MSKAEDIAASVLLGLTSSSSPANNREGDHASSRRAANTAEALSKFPPVSHKPGPGGLAKPSSSKGNPKKRSKGRKTQHKFPVEPTVISMVDKPRDYINHSYRDFSKVPAEIGYETPTEIAQMTFSQKVHHILSQDEYKKWISWWPHGRAFRIHVPVYFERNVCPKYFGHKRYSSFLRQLNNFGFKHITRGTDRNSYYHEFMLKDRPHLCRYMPNCKDARRLIPDPENEPDFYAISKKYPLSPDDQPVDSEDEEEEEEMAKKPPAVAAAKPPPPPPQPPVEAAAAVASAALPSTPASALGPRLASDVTWLLDQLPQAKMRRTALTAPQDPPSLTNRLVVESLDTTTALRSALQAQREATLAAAALQVAQEQQRKQQQQQQLAAALLGSSATHGGILNDPTKTAALIEFVRRLQS